jgi:acyl carrier protein
VGRDIDRALGDDVPVIVMSPSVLGDDTAGPALLDSLGTATNVGYAPNLSSSFDADAGYRLFNAARSLTAALATMASPPRLFLLTRRVAADEDPANPAHAILWGLGRALALEHPDIWGGVIDLDASAPAEQTAVDAGNGEKTSAPVGPIKDVWRVCEPDVRRRLLRDHVAVLVAAVMGLPSSQTLNPSADFFELGMDSLMSVVLQRALGETLGEEVPSATLFDYPTVEALADYLTMMAAAERDADDYETASEAALSERVN